MKLPSGSHCHWKATMTAKSTRALLLSGLGSTCHKSPGCVEARVFAWGQEEASLTVTGERLEMGDRGRLQCLSPGELPEQNTSVYLLWAAKSSA